MPFALDYAAPSPVTPIPWVIIIPLIVIGSLLLAGVCWFVFIFLPACAAC